MPIQYKKTAQKYRRSEKKIVGVCRSRILYLVTTEAVQEVRMVSIEQIRQKIRDRDYYLSSYTEDKMKQ